MRRALPAGGALAVAIGGGLAAAPVAAQLSSCPVGMSVYDGTGKRGTVVAGLRVGTQLTCRVDIDNGPKGQSYPAWKLKEAEPVVRTRSRIKPGHYACGTRVSPQQSEIVFSASSLYIGQSGSTGNYRFDPNTQEISFLSGEYLGYRGRNMGEGGVQLSRITSATPSNITCTWRY